MKYCLLLSFCILTTALFAQDDKDKNKIPLPPPSPSHVLNMDSAITTKRTVTIKGVLVPYTATAGTIPVWDDQNRPIAGVFYTYYERDDVKDRSTRPLVISFNGG